MVPLDITYDGQVHDAVEVQGMNADTDHVTPQAGRWRLGRRLPTDL